MDAAYICKKCHYAKMKAWEELSDEEQFLASRLPLSAEFSLDERKKHRFCTRCWYESLDDHASTIT